MTIAFRLAPYIFGALANDDGATRDPGGTPQLVDARTFPVDSDIDITERTLVTRLHAGDPRAMETVVLEYADRLIRFGHTLVQDWSDAEELVYEVLGNLWQQRASIDPNRSLKTYLFSAVRNRALNRIAYHQVRVRSASYLKSEVIAESSVLTPEDILFASADEAHRRSQIVALREAITTLSDRHRHALHLRFEQELSYPAIGRILDISDKAAQQLVLRAIGNLRRILEV